MRKSLVNSKGFSLVELMVTIAIIAILAAIAVPAYSNYILKSKFQEEIGKMDNYRKAIAIYIQTSGMTTDAEFQSGIANVKDNYFGDDNVAVMSELKENNGRLLAHPIIKGTTYQIAITPRINDNGSLINWECDIRNETDNSAPPSGAMPNGCNISADDLNDDQVAYSAAYGDITAIRDALITTAHSAWAALTADYVTASTDDTTTEGSLGSLNALKTTAEGIQNNNTNAINSARDVMDDYFNPYDTSNLDTNYTSTLSGLNDDDNGVSTLENQLSTLNTELESIAEGTSDYTAKQTEISNKETAITTARTGQGLTELTAYRDSIADTNSTEYTAANTAVANRTTEISNLTTAKTNYDAGVGAASGLASTVTNYNTQISNKNSALSSQASTDSDFINNTNAATQEFSDSLVSLNSSDAYSGDHVDKNNS